MLWDIKSDIVNPRGSTWTDNTTNKCCTMDPTLINSNKRIQITMGGRLGTWTKYNSFSSNSEMPC